MAEITYNYALTDLIHTNTCAHASTHGTFSNLLFAACITCRNEKLVNNRGLKSRGKTAGVDNETF